MNIKQIIIHFFTFNYPQYSIAFVVKAILIVGLFLFIYKYKPRWRNAAYFFLLISVIRMVLFDQYYSWGYYTDQLGVDEVGWRQKSVLDFEHNKFFKTQKIRFFAVGSSQTLVVYTPYSEKHKDLSVLHLSSMAPLDFYLYRKYIVSKNPNYVLLYLSEFDLAREPRLEAAKIAPQQGIDLLKILPMIFEISKQAHSEVAFKEMIAGEFFPEYKYSFVFRGFSDKIMKKNAALHRESLLLSLHPDTEELKEHIQSLVESMDERWIKYNVYFLREFLAYCRSKSLKVVIVDGQYNPLAYTEKNLRLNQIVHNELENLTKQFDNVTFLPRSQVMEFTQDDYSDATHVKPQAAYRFVESLIKKF